MEPGLESVIPIETRTRNGKRVGRSQRDLESGVCPGHVSLEYRIRGTFAGEAAGVI